MKILEILTEARMAPLYHTTTLGAAVKIINADMIKGYTGQKIAGKFEKGVSLTRSKQFAHYWINNSEVTDGTGVVFQFDQQKLIANKKIKPVDYFEWQGDYDVRPHMRRKEHFAESEEFVIGDINNLSRYVTRLIVDARTLEAIHADPEIKKVLSKFPIYKF